MTFKEGGKFLVWLYFCVIRRSSRKRTFSMSPTSSTAKKDQEEQKTVKENQENENNCHVPEKEMTKAKRSSKGPENTDVSAKTAAPASQKLESRKSKDFVLSDFELRTHARLWCASLQFLIWLDWCGSCHIFMN